MNPDFVFIRPNDRSERAAELDEVDERLTVKISADASKALKQINTMVRKTAVKDFRPTYVNADDAALKDVESRRRASER